MGSAVETLCGQAHGAHRYDMLGIYLQRATIVLALVGLPMTLLYTFSYPILVLLGEPKTVSYMGSLYIAGLIPQIFAYAVNFTAQKFLQAQSIVTPSAYISAAALLLQISLTYITVYVMGLGLMGIAYVLTICWWVIVGAQTLYITKSQRFRHTWTGLSWRSFQGLWSFFKLSAGSAVMICLEMWYSQILVLLAGLLKDPALSLDSLSIWYVPYYRGFIIFVFVVRIVFGSLNLDHINPQKQFENKGERYVNIFLVLCISWKLPCLMI